MNLLKVSTTRNISILMVQTADHLTGLAGLTLTITASKDGAAFASIAPTVTDLGSGWYSLALTTTHTNTLGDLALHVTGTLADPTDVKYQVVTDLPGASVASVTGNVAGSIGSVATGGIAAASFASGAIDNAAIATDAIGSAELAASAVTEIATAVGTGLTLSDIADAVWDEALAGHATAGTAGKKLSDLSAGSAPTAAANAQAVWDYLVASAVTSGSFGLLVNAIAGYLDTEVAAIKSKTDLIPAAPAAVGDVPTANQNADALILRQTSVNEAAVKAAPLCFGAALQAAVHKTRDNAGTLEIADSAGSFAGANALSRAVTTDASNAPIDALGTIA